MDYYRRPLRAREAQNVSGCSILEQLQKKTNGYHGLLIQGNTCYLNSLLQVLFMTKNFRVAVESRPTSTAYRDQKNLDFHLKDLFEKLMTGITGTTAFIQALGIEPNLYELQDAAEYFEKIMNMTSPFLSQIFSGMLKHTTKCVTCLTTIEEEIPFWTLPLSIEGNLCNVSRGLNQFFTSSNVGGKDQIYCEKCGMKTNATIECQMKHHPEVLTLLLKRFEFDNDSMLYVKSNSSVDVPPNLEIASSKYELYAVVNHVGSLRFGHYTATIKSFEDGLWYEFNDTIVSKTTTFLERSEKAYLLMYSKSDGNQERSETNATCSPEAVIEPTSNLLDDNEKVSYERLHPNMNETELKNGLYVREHTLERINAQVGTEGEQCFVQKSYKTEEVYDGQREQDRPEDCVGQTEERDHGNVVLPGQDRKKQHVGQRKVEDVEQGKGETQNQSYEQMLRESTLSQKSGSLIIRVYENVCEQQPGLRNDTRAVETRKQTCTKRTMAAKMTRKDRAEDDKKKGGRRCLVQKINQHRSDAIQSELGLRSVSDIKVHGGMGLLSSMSAYSIDLFKTTQVMSPVTSTRGGYNCLSTAFKTLKISGYRDRDQTKHSQRLSKVKQSSKQRIEGKRKRLMEKKKLEMNSIIKQKEWEDKKVMNKKKDGKEREGDEGAQKSSLENKYKQVKGNERQRTKRSPLCV